MTYQLLARLAFALSPIAFALAAWPNPASAGWAALAVATPLLLWLRIRRPGAISATIKNRQLMQLGLAFAGVNGLVITALAIAPVPTVVALSTLAGAAGLLIAPLFHQKVSLKDLLALPLAVVGGVLVVSGSPPDTPPALWPIMIAEVLLLAISMHLFADVSTKDRASAAQSILALQIPPLLLLILTPFSMPAGPETLLYIAIGGALIALGNLMLYYSFDSIPAHRTLIIKPLSTVMAAVLGVVLLGDPWTVALLAGGALIIVSTVIIGTEDGKRKA